jgi:serine/threonine-protein kinase
MINQTIAHYRITAKLGRGAWARCIGATDTKLDREVAIKVLPDSFAQDKERLARFDREAKLLASLNHPNIAEIHGLEQTGHSHALVLELVEGEDLSERLKRGALPVEEALDVCKQIAEALEAAHEKGIIHRDFKPGNVKLTAEGKVKVLDFGLAKTGTADSTSIAPDSPTITADYTMPGTLLGTAGYMSPEQARGKPVDKRSDIWSFGMVLFECLTGKRLFPGETVTDSIGVVLHKEPDWTALPPNNPATIHLCLRKCLAKDRKRRLHDIANARVDLEQAIADPSSSFIRLSEGALRGTKTGIGISKPVVAVLVLLATFVSAVTVWFLKPLPPPQDSETATAAPPPRLRKLAPHLADIWHDHRNTRTLLARRSSHCLPD